MILNFAYNEDKDIDCLITKGDMKMHLNWDEYIALKTR